MHILMERNKMTKFNKDMYLESLPIPTYKELVTALNKNSNWIILANYVVEQLGYQRSWIQELKKSSRTASTPGDNLLFDLNVKMCTVEILCTLLEDCELYDILAILCLPEPLVIIQHPTHEINGNTLELSFGEHVHLTCKAIGIPPPNYVWYHENMQLKNCCSQDLDFNITSASQAGEYKCEISQVKTDGTVISMLVSKSVFVNVTPTPIVIEVQPVPILEVKDGETFSITCKAHSHPPPKYQWFRDNTKLEGETSNTLRVEHFRLKDEGKYYCYTYNSVSEVYSERTHVMLQLPRQKASAKVALIIGNGDYQNHECLQTPKNDAAKIANLLREIGFKVICLMNLTTTQMKNALRIFSEILAEGVYGLFYFAGHGFKMQESYMLAIDAPNVYLRKDAICEGELLAVLLQKDPTLLVVILDMCQTVPPKQFNPNIHEEIPIMNEYKSRKNLRNLVQAYSTSSHRPSYERMNSKYGLYMTHLSKYISKDIPVTKVFEEVGKSIDARLKGTERNQIPMFALTITKPFRLTDAIYKNNSLSIINNFNKLIAFPTKNVDICFKQANIYGKLIISPYMEPYLNLIKITLLDLDDFEINFFNSVPTKHNNLYQNAQNKEWWIHNPQVTQGPLVISASRNGTPIGATLLNISEHIPALLKDISA